MSVYFLDLITTLPSLTKANHSISWTILSTVTNQISALMPNTTVTNQISVITPKMHHSFLFNLEPQHSIVL